MVRVRYRRHALQGLLYSKTRSGNRSGGPLIDRCASVKNMGEDVLVGRASRCGLIGFAMRPGRDLRDYLSALFAVLFFVIERFVGIYNERIF